ncbi:HNH nuclease [Vibrio phage 1.063.O._10N.261.45.C7]|nr:HNH nuclease [Vibrio phage 1.063.O._10N.261.45.C7]
MKCSMYEWVPLRQGKFKFSRYEINEAGVVWDKELEREVSQVLTGKPQYYYVNLNTDCGNRKLKRVNNVMAWSFLGDPPTPSHTSDHIDQNKLNNHISNIRWADRRTQTGNRKVTSRLPCGTPVTDFLHDKGYDLKQGIGRFIYFKMREGVSYIDSLFMWRDFLSPIKPVPVREYPSSIEYLGVWYPTKKPLNEKFGNVSYDVFLSRLHEGMSLEEALTYQYVNEVSHFYLGNHYDNFEGHCKRLHISHDRIRAKMSKLGVSFEEAIALPVERVIKHCINGEVKRNTEWYKMYNIPSRTANSWMNKKNHKGEPYGRTFKDVLEKYGVDTSTMKIYPCDGEVIMYNNQYL